MAFSDPVTRDYSSSIPEKRGRRRLLADAAGEPLMRLHRLLPEEGAAIPHPLIAISGASVLPGEAYLSHTPVLDSHVGTQPDLFMRWNRIPLSAVSLDVVVHLHGFSQ